MGNIATSLENTLHQESRDLLFWIRHCFSGWKTKSRPWKRMFRHFSSLQTDLNSNPCLTPVISCEHWCSPCYSIFGGLHTVIIFFLTTGPRCYLYPIIICLCFFFHRYWKNKHLSPKRLSTGILMYTLASAICEEIHLYGFWPFGFDPNTREDLPYHYYDKKGTKFTTKWQESHQLPAEFQLLYRMHGEGLAKLTLSHCA